MTNEQPIPSNDLENLSRMPGWVIGRASEDIETVAFRSGAALAVLHDHVGVHRGDVPQDLLRDRLALRAAEAGLTRAGRAERAADIRDEVHLQRSGETLGPGGAMFVAWRQVVRLSLKGIWASRLPNEIADVADVVLASIDRNACPVGQGAAVLEAALRAEIKPEAGLMLSDCILSRALGWPFTVPLLGLGLKNSDHRAEGHDLLLSCHRVIISSAARTVNLSCELSRRARRLRSVAPKLRSKGAEEALRLFLSEDALTPSVGLSPMIKGRNVAMTGRSARRLCDRLVELGVVQELTRRDAFRLYGL